LALPLDAFGALTFEQGELLCLLSEYSGRVCQDAILDLNNLKKGGPKMVLEKPSSSKDSPKPSGSSSRGKPVIMQSAQRLPGETSQMRAKRVVHQIKISLAKRAGLID